jgi:predicted RecA/RadA family phage recombinase
MNNKVQQGDVLDLVIAGGGSAGDPVLIGAGIKGVLVNDCGAGAVGQVMTDGVFDLSVVATNAGGPSAVVVGDAVYIAAGVLSKNTAGAFFGYALEAINAGLTATINVLMPKGPGPGELNLLAGAVDTADIADNAITTAKILNANVTADKLAANAVTSAKITDANVTLAKLAAGVTPSHVVKFAGEATTTGGAAAEDIAVAGALASDILICSLLDNGTNNVTIVQSEADADKIAVTFSGDPGNDAVVSYMLLRAAA